MSSNYPTEWAKFIIESREELGLSQRRFAGRFKLGRSTVQFYESGRLKAPHYDNRIDLERRIKRALKQHRDNQASV